MRAVITGFNRTLGWYDARTENRIALTFTVPGGEPFELKEVLEIDLLNLVSTQQVTRTSTGEIVRIKIGAHDLHDLDLPMAHGQSRVPNLERLSRGA